jgi:hypothetical protein
VRSEQVAVFRRQAANCESRSPLYARICRELAGEPLVAEVAPDLRWDLPLRLLGGLHYLALTESIDVWDDVRGMLASRGEWLRRFVSEQGVQTNEVGRCFGLLPCFLSVARDSGCQELDLVELGPSAGLNLLWDRYSYRYQQGSREAPGGLLELGRAERGQVPGELLGLDVIVGERVGIDLEPVDVTRDDGACLLKAFVWADQVERLERLDLAIETVRRDPPRLVKGDYVELLPEILGARRPNALTVVFQTASLGYVAPERREAVHAALDDAGRGGRLAWVTSSFDAAIVDGFPLEARVWPGPQRRLALMDFHGGWLDWLAA